METSKLRWWFATVILRAGVGIFAFAALMSVGILMEGVTHRFGEGEVAAPESPEQTRNRLTLIGWMLIAAVSGWIMVRFGGAFRHTDARWRIVGVRLTAELLMLVGGMGLALAGLVGYGNRLAAYEVADEYEAVAIAGLISGPVLFALGWLVYRRSVRMLSAFSTNDPMNS